MKFGHNFCADIPELITRVSESQHLSRKTKEIMFSKLDDVYYKMLEADADTDYDFYHVWNDINENFEISDSEKEIIDFLCFTRTRRFTESTYLKELDITEAVKSEKKIKDKVPIFFIFNGGNNVLSRSIMLFTQSNFSHVSLSTSGLDEIISFATTSQNFGLVVKLIISSNPDVLKETCEKLLCVNSMIDLDNTLLPPLKIKNIGTLSFIFFSDLTASVISNSLR
jgi:hypothetical protein